jgi:hypothetical protein
LRAKQTNPATLFSIVVYCSHKSFHWIVEASPLDDVRESVLEKDREKES